MNIPSMEQRIESALQPGRYIGYMEAGSFLETLWEISDEISSFIQERPRDVARLFELFIAACHEKIEELDDSDGSLAEFVEQLFMYWLDARLIGNCDDDKTFNYLATWFEKDPYGMCHRLDRVVAKWDDHDFYTFFVDSASAKFFELHNRQHTFEERTVEAYRHRIWQEALKRLTAETDDVDTYIRICAGDFDKDDCSTIAQIYERKKNYPVALDWVEKAIRLSTVNTHGITYGVSDKLNQLRHRLLAQTGKANEVLQEIWTRYSRTPSPQLYKELLSFCPDSDKARWHEKAMAIVDHAPFDSVIPLLLEQEDTDRLVRRIENATDKELDNLSSLEAKKTAKLLSQLLPLSAARLFIGEAEKILDASRSRAYHYAIEYLEQARDCLVAAGKQDEWLNLATALEAEHSRKRNFIDPLQALIAGEPSHKPSPFLEHVRRKWPFCEK